LPTAQEVMMKKNAACHGDAPASVKASVVHLHFTRRFEKNYDRIGKSGRIRDVGGRLAYDAGMLGNTQLLPSNTTLLQNSWRWQARWSRVGTRRR
jgi:hypothetical protein